MNPNNLEVHPVDKAATDKSHGAGDTGQGQGAHSLSPTKSLSLPFRSLQFKLIGVILGLVFSLIWGLALFALSTLEKKLEKVQLDQQFASVQYVAAELDEKISRRLKRLTSLAGYLDSRRLDDVAYLEKFLEQNYRIQMDFSAGMAVIGMDGRTYVDFPVAPGRRGTYFGDRDYFRQAVETRKPFIDKPVMGRALKRPVLTLSTPVLDDTGHVRAVVTGIVDLTAPQFMGLATDADRLGQTEMYIVSLKDQVIIASTDKRRIMTSLSPAGSSEITDFLRTGFEGSVVSKNAQGIEKLYSAKRIPSTDWIVVQALPAEVAFQPLVFMRNVLLGGALAATLAAVLVAGWLARRLLYPLKEATRQLEAMSSGREAVRELPVAGDEEIQSVLTSFNRLTARLRSVNQELQLEIVERCRVETDLRAANKELEGFTFATSHDLRGPLGRINSFATLLEHRYRERLDGDGLVYLDFIRLNARRLVHLVDDLLNHARAAQGTLESQPLDLQALVDAVLQEKTVEIADAGADVRLNVPPVKVRGDTLALIQVLDNLLQNSLKYSDPARAPVVEIGGKELDSRVRLWVRDNGIGFDMAYHDQIFEMFRRLHTYTEYEGSGVGLALVKRAMERMGGKVWAESKPGRGATFFLELAACEEDAIA